MSIIVTFGRAHIHDLGYTTIDHNCVFRIPCSTHVKGRAIAWELFGDKFCFTYDEADLKASPEKWEDFIRYFPRGVIDLVPEEKE